MTRLPALLAMTLLATAARAAEPVKIGITTILSGPYADRGQSEQYGAQIALDRLNQAGGVLGRFVEAYYADNACDPKVGVPATERLIQQEHVPVLIGALCTPVTHAIEPVVKAAQVPLIIATSAGQDFVDASGAGGNPYLWKTIPSEIDIAHGLLTYLSKQGVKSVAIVGDDNGFSRANVAGFGRVAGELGITVTSSLVVPTKTADMAPLVAQLRTGSPQVLLSVLGPSAAPFFKALAASGWDVPIAGRLDFAALDPEQRGKAVSVAVFTPADPTPAVHDFTADYLAHTGLVPTQRSFYVYEAVLLAADAIKRAGKDDPAAIEEALKTSAMPSALGGTYNFDEHNHPHMPLRILVWRDGKPAVAESE